MAGALIGALRVSLSAETSAFEAGMKRSQRQAKATASSIEGSFKGVGNALKAGIAGFVSSVSAGAILAAGKAALDYAGSLGEVAQQLGVTTRELQTFRFAAQQMGASQAEADQALGKLSVSMSKALSGSKQAAAAFQAVGVSLVDLQTKSKTEIIGQIADEMNRTGGASQNAAAGVAIFGRGFQKIGALMASGSRGMNELAMAAEELGIVLSDEQIQKADETADKLDAMQTVLKARIAGVVADNADSILQFANALGDLVRFIGSVVGALSRLNQAIANIPQPPAWLQGFIGGPATMGIEFLKNITNEGMKPRLGRSATVKLGAARPFVPAVSGSPKQFLAGGGGGRKGGKDRSAEEAERKRLEALRDANQFDQDIRRANIDILNAKRDLATDEVERYAISIQIKDAERAAFASQLQYEVQAKERTQVEADTLLLKYDEKDAIERQKLIEDENARAAEASTRLDGITLEIQRDAIAAQLQNATTAKKQRKLQLRILDLTYQIEKARLEAVIADKQSSDAAKEEARRRLAALPQLKAQDRQGIIGSTAGPIEEYLKSIPSDAAEAQEALERLAVDGVQKLEDSLVDVLMGTKSLKEAFHDMAAQILEDLLRMAIQQFVLGPIMQALGGAAGGGFAEGGLVGGYASGGFVSGPGGPTADRVPAMLSNGEFVINAKATKKFLPLLRGINDGEFARMAAGGLAIPRASMGERIKMSDDNEMGGRGQIVMHNDFRGADASAVAGIKAHLNQLEQTLPSRIVTTVQDAKSRFIIR